MGWWETADGTVIGDELADILGGHREAALAELLRDFPAITKEQILHTVAFSFGYIPPFDEGKEPEDGDKVLVVMTMAQREEWSQKHSVPPDESKKVAPGTGLLNVKNPFTGDADVPVKEILEDAGLTD